MASEATFDHWKVVFSWLMSHEEKWEKLNFLKTLSSADFYLLNSYSTLMCQIKKKSTMIHFFSQSMLLPLVPNMGPEVTFSLTKMIKDSVLAKWQDLSRGFRTCYKHCQRHNGPEGWVHLAKVFLRSYHKSKNKSWSHFIFRISTKLQLKIPTKHQHYCNCNCNCNCNYNVQLFYLLSLETNMSGNLCH